MALLLRLWSLFETRGITLLLQFAVLAIAVSSVEAAEWLDAPSLVLLVLLASILAAFAGSTRKLEVGYHILAIALGAVIAYLSAAYLTDAQQWDLKFVELHDRMAEWWLAVTGEDATNDTLPLSMILVMVTWLAAYLSSWTLFKYGNVWITLVAIGMGMMVTLTYLPESFFTYMLGFFFFALLLVVHVTGLKRRSDLQVQGKTYPATIHRMSLVHGMMLSVVTLGAVAVVPMVDSDIRPLRWAIKPIDSTVEDFRQQLHRVFASVPGHRLASLRFHGPVLPLVRPVPVGEDPVLSSNSQFPFYWPAVAYDEYTSKAWKVEDVEERPLTTFGPTQPEEEEEGLEPVAPSDSSMTYSVQMHVDSPYLMMGGKPVYVEPGAEQQIPVSETFNMDLTNMEVNEGLPPQLKELASGLSVSTAGGASMGLADIPPDVLVTRLTKQLSSGSMYDLAIDSSSSAYRTELSDALQRPGSTVSMEVALTPVGISPVSYKPLERLRPNSTYRVIAELNLGSEEAMREAGQDYYPGIVDRYLQVPDSLPPRVRTLAAAITEDTSNPYDSAVAIEAFLRTMEYTTVPEIIEHDADVVDHFLFVSREGYSDHFASSMAMMLRTLGIPTRLVLGFGPGNAEEGGDGYMVRDLDSHTWPEVFFPNIGWIPFEPTPIYPLRLRGLPGGGFNLEEMLGVGELGPDEEGTLTELLEPEEEQQERDDFGGPLEGGQGLRALPFRHFGTPLGWGGALFVGFTVIGLALLRFFWMMQYGEFSTPETAYNRVRRLAVFLGIPSSSSQTPYEFAAVLAEYLPDNREDIDIICQGFVEKRFGRRNTSAMEVLRMLRAWNRIKRSLMGLKLQAEEATPSTA